MLDGRLSPLRATGRRAPRWPFQLNKSSPLRRGLEGAALFNIRGCATRTPELLRRNHWVFSAGSGGTLSEEPRPEGLTVRTNPGAFVMPTLVPTTARPTISGPMTLLFVGSQLTGSTAGGSNHVVALGDGSGQRISIDTDGTIGITLGGSGRFSSTGAVSDNEFFTLGVEIDAGGPYRIYINGVLTDEQLSDSNFGDFGATGRLLGRDGTGCRQMDLLAFADWSRVLSADEHWALYSAATRWDLFEETWLMDGPEVWATAPPAGANPKGVFGLPFQGPFGGPIG